MKPKPPQYKVTVFSTDRGRYVWDPVLSIVDYYDKGKQRPRRTHALTIHTNWYDGALRAVAYDILNTTKAGGMSG